jgi:hypothetical protein
MGLKGILAEIDKEIARLQQVRGLLAGETKRGPGGPKNVANVEKPSKKKGTSLLKVASGS